MTTISFNCGSITLSDDLPYQDFDHPSHLFINKTTVGMGLHFTPLAAASDQTADTLNTLFCTLPEGEDWHYQINLTTDHCVEDAIDANERAYLQGSTIDTAFAQHEANIARASTRHTFKSRLGKPCQCDLRRHRGTIWVSTTKPQRTHLPNVMQRIRSTLDDMGLNTRFCDAKSLIEHVHLRLNGDDTLDPDRHTSNDRRDHNHGVTRHFNHPQGQSHNTTLVTLGLHRLPTLFSLLTPQHDLADPLRTIPCPLNVHLAFTLQKSEHARQDNERQRRFLNQWATSPLARFTPALVDKHRARQTLQQHLDENTGKLANGTFTVVFQTTESRRQHDTLAAKYPYHQGGLQLNVVHHRHHKRALFHTLPFMPLAGRTNKKAKRHTDHLFTTQDLAKIAPIIGDRQRSEPGLLLPTFRRSLYHFDLFQCGDDQNVAISGAAGSGKSLLCQRLIRHHLARGGRAWIIDPSDSYYGLTQDLHGSVLSTTSLGLNPFTLLPKRTQDRDGEMPPDIKQSLNEITAWFALLCAPTRTLNTSERATLFMAVSQAWDTHQEHTLVDHVQAQLVDLDLELGTKSGTTLAEALFPYCQHQPLGHEINQPSQLNVTAPLTTLALDNRCDEERTRVLFAVLVNVQLIKRHAQIGQQQSLCLLDDAHDLLKGQYPELARFMTQSYCDAKHDHSAFITVTQGVERFLTSDALKAAYDASDIRLYLRHGRTVSAESASRHHDLTPDNLRQIQDFEPPSQTGFVSLMLRTQGIQSFHRLFCLPSQP
ncbi:TraC family protein [Vibrio mediterranei]